MSVRTVGAVLAVVAGGCLMQRPEEAPKSKMEEAARVEEARAASARGEVAATAGAREEKARAREEVGRVADSRKDEPRPDDVPPPPPAAHKRTALAPKEAPAASRSLDALTADEAGGRGGGAGVLGGVVGYGSARREAPRSAGVQAGSSDDNLSFNAFLKFLADNGKQALPLDVSDRLVVEVRDAAGLPVFGARVRVVDGAKTLAERRTYPDGRTLIFPRGLEGTLRVDYGGASAEQPLAGPHLREVRLDVRRKELQRVPLDVAFVLDTTGSMADEIERLRQTLDVIHFQLTHLEAAVDVRFGLMEYKDRGDEPVTKAIAFTSDVESFRAALQTLRASGGGDEPEDVQAGLEQALHGLSWRNDAVKVAFLIGDAPPHLDYGEKFTYVSAMKEAAQRGIKFASIGCSGLPTMGEVVWRELAQYTMGPYVFLTRGERGDSEGSPSSVSHHVGSNWTAENLETIVVRLVKSELAHLQPRLVARQDDYFEARPGSPETVLQDLFKQSAKQLVDYSVERIEEKTPTVVLPFSVKAKSLEKAAASLQTRLELGLSGGGHFRLLERSQLKDVLTAMEAQLGDSYDPKRMVEAGKLVPAKLAVLGQLAEDASGKPEMLVKLVRLETGELLSLSLLRIDRALLR